jgi:hypothetical protein
VPPLPQALSLRQAPSLGGAGSALGERIAWSAKFIE